VEQTLNVAAGMEPYCWIGAPATESARKHLSSVAGTAAWLGLGHSAEGGLIEVRSAGAHQVRVYALSGTLVEHFAGNMPARYTVPRNSRTPGAYVVSARLGAQVAKGTVTLW
jgi:hypothetical protein